MMKGKAHLMCQTDGVESTLEVIAEVLIDIRDLLKDGLVIDNRCK